MKQSVQSLQSPRKSSNNVVTFLEELTDSLSRAINNYDNIILMGDFNVDIKKQNSIAYDKLEEFCDTFYLTHLVKPKSKVFLSYIVNSL